MTRSWRWLVVLAVVAALASLPPLVASLPLGTGSDAGALLERMRDAESLPYSGHAESSGSLALPAADVLDDVSTLLGGRTQVRVWWRAPDDWRVDTLTPTGERDEYSVAAGTAVWDYEDNRTVYGSPDLGRPRLPRARDAVPPQLAARLLAAATPDLVTALPPRLVAGRTAHGLRLRPPDELGSIERVDVWADPDSGIPVHVEVFGRGARTAAVSATFLAFTSQAPAAATTRFVPPAGSRVRSGDRFDLVQAIGQVPDQGLPPALLGYPRVAPLPGLAGIAQYGRGTTQFAVGALPPRAARSLREQLAVSPGATVLPEGLALSVGPLALLLIDSGATGTTLLLTGTLTPEGLALAAEGLRPGASR